MTAKKYVMTDAQAEEELRRMSEEMDNQPKDLTKEELEILQAKNPEELSALMEKFNQKTKQEMCLLYAKQLFARFDTCVQLYNNGSQKDKDSALKELKLTPEDEKVLMEFEKLCFEQLKSLQLDNKKDLTQAEQLKLKAIKTGLRRVDAVRKLSQGVSKVEKDKQRSAIFFKQSKNY